MQQETPERPQDVDRFTPKEELEELHPELLVDELLARTDRARKWADLANASHFEAGEVPADVGKQLRKAADQFQAAAEEVADRSQASGSE